MHLTSLRPTIKTIAIILLIVIYTLLSAGLGLLPISRWSVQKIRSRINRIFCQLGLKIMGVTVTRKGRFQEGTNYLIVSNHLSYLDILLISSHLPSCFVTSVEVKHAPFLGLITKWAGCIFVERRNKDNIMLEIAEMTEALSEGLNIVIFPEATSTNGQGVLRFRCPLYNSAIAAQRQILPICLNYKKIDGENLNKENRDKVFWYGSMEFFPHLVGLMKLKTIEVEIEFLDSIKVIENSDAKTIAESTHGLIVERFVPCL